MVLWVVHPDARRHPECATRSAGRRGPVRWEVWGIAYPTTHHSRADSLHGFEPLTAGRVPLGAARAWSREPSSFLSGFARALLRPGPSHPEPARAHAPTYRNRSP